MDGKNLEPGQLLQLLKSQLITSSEPYIIFKTVQKALIQHVLYSVCNCLGVYLEAIAFKDRSLGQMTECLIQNYNFKDLITNSIFTHVLKGAKPLQLPLKSEDSVFGDSTPYQTEQMLRNDTCKTQEFTSLCRQQKSCSTGKYLQWVIYIPIRFKASLCLGEELAVHCICTTCC